MTTVRAVASLLTADGEVIEFQELVARKTTFGRRFTVMFDDELLEFAATIRNGATARVFLALPSYLEYQTWKRIDQEAVAKKLKLDRSSITRALQELLELKIISRRGKTPYHEWKLTTSASWRGGVKMYQAARREELAEPAVNPARSRTAAEYVLWKKTSDASLDLRLPMSPGPFLFGRKMRGPWYDVRRRPTDDSFRTPDRP